MSGQDEVYDYQATLKQQKEQRTAAALTPADLQRIIDAAAVDPSIWDRFPEFRDLKRIVGEQELEISQLRETPWIMENINSAYKDGFKAMQKSAVSVDVMADSAISKAVVHGRGMMGAGKLISRKRGPSLWTATLAAIVVIFSAAIAWNLATTPGALANVGTSNFYGFPTLGLIFVLVVLGLYVIYRHQKRVTANPL